MNNGQSVKPEQEQDNKKIKISIPEQYKRNLDESVWEELEEYLFTGFLTSQAYIAGNSFVFKTLNWYESNFINYLKPAKESAIEQKLHFQASFIAHSIFITEGENVLFDRPNHIRRLINIIKKIPTSFQNEIILNLSYINKKAVRLYPLVEVYVHENKSRLKWLQLKNLPIHSPQSTGISGTEHLGMNLCQSTWVALNRLIDIKDESERDWNNAKFVGSCFAKGVRSIDQQDKQQKDIERQKLEDLKIEVLYKYLNRIDDDKSMPKQVSLPDGRTAEVVEEKRAQTVDELAEQLQNALNEEKDHHDIVI
jgi:hypothetical protein